MGVLGDDVIDSLAPPTGNPSVVSFDALPSWAEAPAFSRPTPPAAEQIDEGLCAWLYDTQVHLGQGSQTWLSRTVNEVTSPDGLTPAGQVSIDFDPSFQRLVLHHVRILRAGEAIEVDAQQGLQLLRREQDLERAVFDGRLTAHLSIPDVRVGDVVDLCYSVEGVHPMLADLFCAEWPLSWMRWVGETRVRVMAPAERRFTVRAWNEAPAPRVELTAEGLRTWTWRTCATPAVSPEPLAPEWIRQHAAVRLAEDCAWSQVADRFRPGYALEPLPADLMAQVAGLRTRRGSAGDRIVAALRLVQSSLRYQADHLGAGGFAPRPVQEIWATRTGDCKDAARLLVCILHHLGVAAEPVLVNTVRGEGLETEPPSLAAFDHCVVGLKLSGRRYWIDPTAFPQGGRLEVLHQPRYGWALPLVPVSRLEHMGEGPIEDVLSIYTVYDLPQTVSGAAKMRVETVHAGRRADIMRRRLAAGSASVARAFRDHTDHRVGPVLSAEPLEVRDDLDANLLTTVETYVVKPVWRIDAASAHAEFATVDDLFGPSLPSLSAQARRLPAHLGEASRMRSRTEIHLPVSSRASAWEAVVQKGPWKSVSRLVILDSRGTSLRLEQALSLDRGLVRPDEAAAYAKFREQSLASAELFLRQPVRADLVRPWGRPGSAARAWRVGVLALLALWLVSKLVNLVF